VRGGAQDPDPAAGVLDHREHVHPRAGQGDRFQKVAGQQGVGLGAQEVGPGAGGPLGRRIDPGLFQNLSHGGCGYFRPQDQQFAVQAPVAPAGIFPCQAQHQGTDGTHGPWPALWGFNTASPRCELGFYAARSYSLMSPPRTGLRLIRSWVRSTTGLRELLAQQLAECSAHVAFVAAVGAAKAHAAVDSSLRQPSENPCSLTFRRVTAIPVDSNIDNIFKIC
jgi:hypothetical protein